MSLANYAKRIAIPIEWLGGSSSERTIRRTVGSYERMNAFPKMRALVEASRLAGRTFAEIADRLNGAWFGRASARFDRFTPRLPSELMYRLGLSPARRPAVKLSADEWWISDLASELGLWLTRLRDWARKGYLHARKVGEKGCLVIWADGDEHSRLRKLRDDPRQDRLNHDPPELIRPKDRSDRSRSRRSGVAK